MGVYIYTRIECVFVSRDVITYSLIEAKVLNVEFLIEPSRNCVTIISPGWTLTTVG